MASLVAWLKYDGARTSDGQPVASGSAWFFQPGTTSTYQTVFADADGLIAMMQPVALDAAGRAEVYTNTAIRIEIQDATGLMINVSDRANTVTAAQVEIENPVATGTDLVTGAQVPGGRTDLDTFLLNLYDSLGASDGQVSINGTPVNISDAMAGTTGVWINVTASPYGADKTGVVDSSDGITAAINVAIAAGGGTVYFPTGAYKLDNALIPSMTVGGANVHLIGDGPTASVITAYQLGYAINVTGANCNVENLGFVAAGVASVAGINSTDTHFFNCNFGHTTSASGLAWGVSGARTIFTACNFVNASTSYSFHFGTSNAFVQFLGGRMVLGNSGTKFTATANGTAYLVNVSITGGVAGPGPTLFDSTLTLVSMVGGQIASFVQWGNPSFFADVGVPVWSASTFTPSTATLGYSQRREQAIVRTSSSVSAYSIDHNSAKFHEVVSTAASMAFSAGSSSMSAGATAEVILRYKNTNAGAVTPTFSATFLYSTVPSVPSGSAVGWHFFFEPTLAKWCQVGSVVAYVS